MESTETDGTWWYRAIRLVAPPLPESTSRRLDLDFGGGVQRRRRRVWV
jgi:hypothetical protein